VTIKGPQLTRLSFPQHGTLEAHLAAIVTSSDDAIISKDLDGIIQSWNRGAERMFGYKPEEAIGQHISMLAVPERRDEFSNILQRISRGEHVDHYHTKRKTKDNRVLSVSLTVSPIRDTSGTIVGASKIARDITDQIRYQQALREANESLTRLNSDLEQFAYSASHDLQEPLRMVTIYAEMIQRKFGGTIGPTGDEYISYIVSGVARMEHLLRDLRAFTQASIIERDSAQSVDAGEAVAIALANLTTAVHESKASIAYGPLPRVQVPRFQLEQLFQNLIGNAIRYRSQEPPEIRVTAEQCGAEWKFSVRDNGIGIDPQYKEQIFGIFKRLHSQAEYPGTGMGLAICQRIVERAGGRIWVESEFGRGSTFLFTLPAGRDPGA
jgi:PAS domain S-box-containing protein